MKKWVCRKTRGPERNSGNMMINDEPYQIFGQAIFRQIQFVFVLAMHSCSHLLAWRLLHCFMMPLAVHIILFVLDMNGLMQFACFWERLAHAHSVCWVAGQDDVQCLMQELFESCKLNGGHQKVCSRNFVQTSSVAMVTRWLLYLVHCDSNRDSLWCIHIYIYTSTLYIDSIVLCIDYWL